ncbi:vWA domain-containing protein [Thermocrinis minervae]|uniref:von Willebrand factor type A domain-containing protein n=1 Tax=Thermocrinis minervae TaxID=381751 RepID=A0A1M6SH02_9AQUI|nr:vWA domain-containing protein [Thermocrinis minervae]SHK43939.1 von Willebrand factor type A domain-containing protein [Thermocrinis minervae]
MKERWKIISSLLEDEYDIVVKASYEGWGSGYDPVYLPLVELWARGEQEVIPEVARKPKGIIYDVQEFTKSSEDSTLTTIRHEIEYITNTDLYLWRLGQREFFRFGYPPSTFVVLYAVLESIKASQRVLQRHPFSIQVIKELYKKKIAGLEELYPHHAFALAFVSLWLGEDLSLPVWTYQRVKPLERSLYEYLSSDNRQAYDILMEEVLGRYITSIEESQELNYIDLLLEEARGKKRQDGHKGRIMTDILRKLPTELQELVTSKSQKTALSFTKEEINSLHASLRAMPEWMRDYLKQMSYISILEKDIQFLEHFLPKTIERDVEHRGFIAFLPKPWVEESLGQSFTLTTSKELSEKDRLYQKQTGMTQEEYKQYSMHLKSVLAYVESIKRRFEKLLPRSEKEWEGGHFYGRKLNPKSLGVEVPIKRGKIFQRRHSPSKGSLAFKLLIDVSSSMRKEDKSINAIRSLILVSEALDALGIPFSIDIFSDKTLRLKSFDEDYKAVRGRLVELFRVIGGGTNLEKALYFAVEDLEVYTKEKGLKGVVVVFTDGEPTRGAKGEELKRIISHIKGRYGVVGLGFGELKNYVDEYFEKTGIKVKSVEKLPSAFMFVLDTYLRRLQEHSPQVL